MRLFVISLCALCACGAWADAGLRFDIDGTGPAPEGAPSIAPSRAITLDPDCGGQWIVAADLDGDGAPEIVSAENFNEGDVHYTSAVAAQTLDGRTLWRWGNPDIGRKTWHHDVACQIHDWDGNGQLDVIVCDQGALVEIDGRTGQEKRRIQIEKEATDCLVFCDLSGKGRPTDVLVKDRYLQVWAYNQAGEMLWTVKYPGGYRTAHQPIPLDIDGDGRDEILAGYALLNHDGTVRWVYASERIELKRGHLDCARVLERGGKPEDWRIALTFCGANAIAAVDGNGNAIWEVTGHHFESINTGKLAADLPGRQLIVDIDHQPAGQSPIWAFDRDGNKIGALTTGYSRHHKLLDWTGDGLDEIVVAHNRALYDARGKWLATLEVPEEALNAAQGVELSVFKGDMDGDGVPDILLALPTHVFIYRNPSGAAPEGETPLGMGLNVTLY